MSNENQNQSERQAVASAAEDHFVDLFTEAFGYDRVGLLHKEYSFQDIEGTWRRIDYAIRTPDARIAFEVDGLQWHMPGNIDVGQYEDALLRQNSLIHLGWQVFRWTDRQIHQEPDRVKDQLLKFLESISDLLPLDEFLPRQLGAAISLHDHQHEALAALAAMRQEGKTIGLLYHATGTGKTVVAIEDARRIGGRTLFLAHRHPLVKQAARQFTELWPDADVGLFTGAGRDPDAFNIVATVQSISKQLKTFRPTDFSYIIVDEAHHATAETYRRVLAFFRPKFVLGLSATPDRADGQTSLELFRDYVHRLDLKTAVEMGQLVPIRCFRVQTNVDLTRVRFNQVQYRREDLEERIVVPDRDRLIIETYQNYVPGKKAVIFCVNVRHAKQVAERFCTQGIAAAAVSGGMSRQDREAHLEGFHTGQLRVLCACDILNEGWDCPDIEALFMARPTLSKVVYLQQLGRGTRLAPGKECLVVFDFVDNATRYNVSLSLHRILQLRNYRPGGLAVAPPSLIGAEEQNIADGKAPTAVINIAVWAKDLLPIDIFDWQQALAGMLTAIQLERCLHATEGTIRRAVETGKIQPDHRVAAGQVDQVFFQKDRVEEIRETLGLPKVTEESIKSLFLAFVGEMDMSASYKPVMLQSILKNADGDGRAEVTKVVDAFAAFYRDRQARGHVIESPSARMARVAELTADEIQNTMLQMPFSKFERKGYLKYDRDLAFLRFDPRLWRQLGAGDLEELRNVCARNIETYFQRFQERA